MIRLKSLLQNLFEQRDEFNNQYNWWISYLQSPMYIDRLKKEFPRKANQLPADWETQIAQERNTRLSNLKNAKSKMHFVKSIESEPGYILGMVYPKQYTGEYWDYKTKSWKKRAKSSDPRDKSGHSYFERDYSPANWDPYPGFETIPAHEFGHLVDDGGYRIPKATIEKIFRYTGGGDPTFPFTRYSGKEFDYESDPTEFINRIQPIRYLLNKQKIYDARKRAFTESDYNKMINSPEIQNNQHFKDIFKSLKGSDIEKKKNFIDIMNSIASMPISNKNVS